MTDVDRKATGANAPDAPRATDAHQATDASRATDVPRATDALRPVGPRGGGYHIDIPLRWNDMDAFGHVNNVSWARLLEQARVETLLDWFGAHGEEILAGQVLLVHQELEYLRTLEYRRAPVRVDVWVASIARTAYTLAYVLRDPEGEGDLEYLRAETTLVSFDLAAGRTRALSGEEQAVLASHLGEPVPLRRRRGA